MNPRIMMWAKEENPVGCSKCEIATLAVVIINLVALVWMHVPN